MSFTRFNSISFVKLTNVLFPDIPDYGQLSSRTVTEVLMVEMKMAPNAKTYLVSGYPRNMRDVVEYSEKVSIHTTLNNYLDVRRAFRS